jgi:Arc/MetJ-type ribon-helix-helix transcriptional regulator
MNEEDFWQQLANMGLKIRPDHANPAQWIGVLRGEQLGPYASREEVVLATLRLLLAKTDSQQQAAEDATDKDRWTSAANLITNLLRIP